MRIISERVLIEDFFKSYIDNYSNEPQLFGDDFFKTFPDDYSRRFWKDYEDDKVKSHRILAPFYHEILNLDRSTCSIADINEIVGRMFRAASNTRFGNFAPRSIKNLVSCKECEQYPDVLVEFDSNCSDCGTFYLCFNCVDDVLQLIRGIK